MQEPAHPAESSAETLAEPVVEHVRSAGAVTRVTRIESPATVETRPFVLVAGIGVAATYFEFLAPALAERGDVYALDLPGFGGVPRSDDREPSIAFFADQVEAVLDHYALEDPVLVGHSMGTQVVADILERRPDLSHAVLVSPVVDEAHPTLFAQALRFAQSTIRESLHLAMTAFAAYLLCGPVYFLTVLPHMLRYRMTRRLAHVRARILFIRGEYDATSPRRWHSRLVAATPDAWRWEIEGASHSIINGHARGAAELTLRHVAGDLNRRGRMPDRVAETPPPVHADIALILGSALVRVAEWFSALRRDEGGVARAKVAHARFLWRAYARR
jgi:pimeloyl-ACP methyl ester carboxylesterase